MLKDFIQFITCPTPGLNNRQEPGSKLVNFIFFWLILYLVVFLANLVSRVTCNFVLLADGTPLLEHYHGNFNSVSDRFGFSILFVGIVIAPLTEELTFRLPLVMNRDMLLLCGCSYIAMLTWNLVISGNHFGIGTLLLPVTGFLLLMLSNELNQPGNPNGFRYMVWLSCFVFGLIHILNYRPLSLLSILLSPLIVLPVALMGLGFAYMRVRFGFFWGLAAHMLINIPGILSIYWHVGQVHA